jgi:ketosteroid isomerase-like protein
MSQTQFESRILIRELYGRYAIAAAEQDTEAWLACWAQDAVWKTPHFEVAGQDALRASWHATWTNFSNAAAFNEVGTITLDGDRAKAVSSVLEIIQLKAGGLLKMAGLYRDALVHQDGQWRFAHRVYEALSQETTAGA